ncbi:28S ribosomal protein S22, mitochondrial [Plutella xylostella]|uniref:28S ribosomal protein S22, mitochondrial n=1 Tax=Plutella xylostella TaxID=51655 RepID=UPI0020328AE8|nr:28S ribosomal protein S22, mitochondrial [Plutella xylostella]
MSLLFRKPTIFNAKNVLLRQNDVQILLLTSKNFSAVPTIYDGESDPAPKFFSSNVQVLLKRLTRPDFNKVFRKRTNSGFPVLKTPQYKFLTTEQLEAEVAKSRARADQLLQMPPVVKVQTHIKEVLSRDPALIGFDTAKYMFTDITLGVDNQHRIIMERDTDGVLQSCDPDVRKRLNQIYFPIKGRKIKEPVMFTDPERFNSLLDREQYEFVLDRACIQYEPDEPSYQKITSVAYQHVDSRKNYGLLRSTRHFGPLTFYLTWHLSMEGLLLELLQNNVIREAVLLVALRQEVHGDVANGSSAQGLVAEIMNTPIQLSKPESLTEEDIQLDTKCIDCIEQYISANSSMKSQQELALQGFREFYQQLIDLSRGVRKAHGNA